jgi:hypothetical protein
MGAKSLVPHTMVREESVAGLRKIAQMTKFFGGEFQ